MLAYRIFYIGPNSSLSVHACIYSLVQSQASMGISMLGNTWIRFSPSAFAADRLTSATTLPLLPVVLNEWTSVPLPCPALSCAHSI